VRAMEACPKSSWTAEHTHGSVYSTTLDKMPCSQEARMGHEKWFRKGVRRVRKRFARSFSRLALVVNEPDQA
jgi:hypothetical protein